jgi:hypothetical protein
MSESNKSKEWAKIAQRHSHKSLFLLFAAVCATSSRLYEEHNDSEGLVYETD